MSICLKAGAHIDELVEISKRGSKNKPDDGSHKWADEWNYRTAFFEDSKGDYYRLVLSVGINDLESAAYNVADIRKRSIPNSGSSPAMRDGGALNGDTSRRTVYHDKSRQSSPQTTSMQEAFKKAYGNSNVRGQFSFSAKSKVKNTGSFGNNEPTIKYYLKNLEKEEKNLIYIKIRSIIKISKAPNPNLYQSITKPETKSWRVWSTEKLMCHL